MQTKPKADAANAVNGALAEIDRTTIVVPCGTGKTLVGVMIANSLAPKALAMEINDVDLPEQGVV